MRKTIRSLYWTGIMERDNVEAGSFGMDLAHPILDRDLVCLLMSIPGWVLNRGGVPRALLREAMRPVLPEAIAQRRTKAPFGHSFGRAFESDIEDVRRFLSWPLRSERAGLLDAPEARREIPRLLRGAEQGVMKDGRAITDLLKAEVWLHRLGVGIVEP
jgi:hypothetical protein